MRKKFRSASALVFSILFGFSFFVASVDIPGQMMTPNVQGRQGGRDFSSSLKNKTSGGVEESLPHKETLESVLGSSAVISLRERNEMENCTLDKDVLAQIQKSNTSEWILNDTTIALLGNDLQQLILCTKSHDRVILTLQKPLKLNKTVEITHDLELIGDSSNTEEGAQVESSYAPITCPDSGPALEVNTNNFVAKGLKFENCTDSVGRAAVVIGANSKAIFNKTTFKDNMNRAVYIAKEANVTFVGTRFEGNQASGNGGAIYAENNSHIEVSSSAFTGNKASRGGAVYVAGHNVLEICESSLSHNTAQIHGGGLFLETNNLLTLTSSTVTNNTAQIHGGGIFAFTYNRVTIHTCSFSSNSARSNCGGGLFLETDNSLTLTSSTVTNNTAHVKGGGIFAYTCNRLTIHTCSFSRNSARSSSGGGLFLETNNSLTLTSSTVTNNTAQQDGGGIRAYKENVLDISGSTFSNSRNFLTMIGSTVSDNSASLGGALHASQSSFDVHGTIFENNTALSNGAIFATSSKLNISNSIFYKNKATSGQGGAIFVHNGDALNMFLTKFVSNTAKYGGALYTSNVNMSLEDCLFNQNNALASGACVFLDHSNIHVKRVTFHENQAHLESGGAIIISSNSTLLAFNVTIRGNKAKKDSGGIYVSDGSFLNATEMRVISNSASDRAGGIGIFSDSSFLCYSCLFGKNNALDGAGIYVRTLSKRHSIIAKLQDSKFANNSAGLSGGGLMFEGPQNNVQNSLRQVNLHTRVVLLNTSFLDNSATLLGSAILVTNVEDVLVSCAYNKGKPKSSLDQGSIISFGRIHPKWLCKSWKGNHLATSSDGVVGTFGKKLSLSMNNTNSSSEVQLVGNETSGFKLKSMFSGEKLPLIQIVVVDEFGNGPAPSVPRSFLIEITSSDNLFQGFVSVIITSGTGNFSDIAVLRAGNNYTLNINPQTTTIKNTKLLIHVFGCLIGEEFVSQPVFCQACGKNAYNFNTTKAYGCLPCPDGATCRGRYIVPKDGYWHKGPCHEHLAQCIVEEACIDDNREGKLYDFSKNFNNCDLSNEIFTVYEQNLCSMGYKGPLCGSCAKDFGLSGNLECLKCGFVLFSVLRLLGIILYLLVGTILTIKGTLFIGSRRLCRQDAMTPLLGGASSLSRDERLSSQVEVQCREETSSQVEVESREETSTLMEILAQERRSNQLEEASQGGDDTTQIATNEEQAVFRTMSSQLAGAFAKAQVNLVESWKILINFFQVTSTAATMDVKWTKEILKFFKMLSFLGAATINSVLRPISCIVASSSIYARVVWRFIFNILVPMIVIAILSIYWFYRSLRRRRGERSFFLRRFVLVVITVIYITYFDITKQVVSVFNCVKVRDGRNYNSPSATKYWIVDTSIECYKSTHVVLVFISVVAFTIVSVCFPLACSWALSKTRDEVQLSNSRAHETLGLLCGPFKKKFVFWECVTMIKKAMLSIIIVFSYSLGNQAQGLLLSLVLMIFPTIHTTCYPFTQEFNSLNYYESGSLLISCATYTIVQFFNDDTLSETSRSLVSISLLILNGGFVAFMVFLLARNLIQLARVVLLSKNADISDGIRWYSILILYLKNRGWNEAST